MVKIRLGHFFTPLTDGVLKLLVGFLVALKLSPFLPCGLLVVLTTLANASLTLTLGKGLLHTLTCDDRGLVQLLTSSARASIQTTCATGCAHCMIKVQCATNTCASTPTTSFLRYSHTQRRMAATPILSLPLHKAGKERPLEQILSQASLR